MDETLKKCRRLYAVERMIVIFRQLLSQTIDRSQINIRYYLKDFGIYLRIRIRVLDIDCIFRCIQSNLNAPRICAIELTRLEKKSERKRRFLNSIRRRKRKVEEGGEAARHVLEYRNRRDKSPSFILVGEEQGNLAPSPHCCVFSILSCFVFSRETFLKSASIIRTNLLDNVCLRNFTSAWFFVVLFKR